MKLKSSNDYLIEELLKDNNYEINKDGTICRKNKKLGRKDKENYIEIYYKGKRLKAHRIIYAKYLGDLDKELVVDHKNADTSDNSVGNLRLCDQKKNIYYRDRRKERTKK